MTNHCVVYKLLILSVFLLCQVPENAGTTLTLDDQMKTRLLVEGLRVQKMGDDDKLAVAAAWKELEYYQSPESSLSPLEHHKELRFVGFIEGRFKIVVPDWWTQTLMQTSQPLLNNFEFAGHLDHKSLGSNSGTIANIVCSKSLQKDIKEFSLSPTKVLDLKMQDKSRSINLSEKEFEWLFKPDLQMVSTSIWFELESEDNSAVFSAISNDDARITIGRFNSNGEVLIWSKTILPKKPTGPLPGRTGPEWQGFGFSEAELVGNATIVFLFYGYDTEAGLFAFNKKDGTILFEFSVQPQK